MNKRYFYGLSFGLLFLFLLSYQGYCLGITPASQEIPYSIGQHDFKFNVINQNPYETINYVEILNNDFGKNVAFEAMTFRLPPNSIGVLSGTVIIDESLEPGENCVRFKLTESKEARTSSIEARTAIIVKACTFVPYPGKYIEALVTQDTAVEDLPLYFTVNLENKGKSSIESCDVSVKIYDASGILVDEIYPDEELSLDSLEKASLFLKTNTPLKGGEYKGKLLLNYDGISDEKEFSLRVGKKEISIVDVPSTFYFKDDILTFKAKLKSFWNEQIDNIYLELSIPSLNKTISSSVFSLNPWEEKEIESIGKIEGITEGVYKVNLTVHYGNDSSSIAKDVKFSVEEPQEDVVSEVQTVPLQKNNVKIPPLAIAMFTFSIIILVYVFILLRKQRNLDTSDL
ncbi:MAG: hypothetical protein PWR30_356 [Candidatus Woesearchaeota archaeon]|nr:hypothetical protein [Candidatus Woesearchaeota archaeon]